MRGTLTAWLLLPALCGAAPMTAPDISANDSAFQVLRRVQSRAGILLPDQTFPQSLSSIAAWLEARALTPYDSMALGPHRYSHQGLLSWRDSARGNAFILAPDLETSYSDGGGMDTAGYSALGGIGARIYGTLGGTFAWYTHALMYTETTGRARFNHQFDPEQGETYSVEKGAGDSLLATRTFNRFEYYVRFDGGWWALKAGRDFVHSGPGYFSSLTVTRGAPPFYLAEARIDFAPWLRLEDYLLKMVDSSYDVQKYANLHRLEFRPLPSLALTYEDMVIYQDRDPDPAYLLPFVPLTFAEANGGGRDNASMSFDAIWAAPHGVSIWGQLFLDDLLGPTSFFDDFWENRWATLAGLQWALPARWADADLIAEYSHVEPWTYNGRKSHTSFKHYGMPSASLLGPDSRTLDVQASWRPRRWAQIREHWQWDEKGIGRQATLGVIHDETIDGTSKSYLAHARSVHRLTHDLKGYLGRYLEATVWWTQAWGEPDRFGAKAGLAW